MGARAAAAAAEKRSLEESVRNEWKVKVHEKSSSTEMEKTKRVDKAGENSKPPASSGEANSGESKEGGADKRRTEQRSEADLSGSSI